jgi:hypothetical protein
MESCCASSSSNLMRELHGLGEARQAEAAAQALRQRVVERPAVQRLQHERAQVGLLQAGGGGIDRRQRGGQRLVLGDDAVARMRHLGAEEARANLAERPHQQPLVRGALELLELAAVEVEEAQHQAFGVHDQLPLRPVHDLRLQHRGLHAHRPARRRRLRRGEDGFVLVAQRQVQHPIEARAQPELVEFPVE